MLPFGATIPATVPQGSEIPEGLMDNPVHIGLHVKYPFSCPILMKLEFSRLILKKFSKIKFYENPSSGSRLVACGR
jgi:hypothetical protein